MKDILGILDELCIWGVSKNRVQRGKIRQTQEDLNVRWKGYYFLDAVICSSVRK